MKPGFLKAILFLAALIVIVLFFTGCATDEQARVNRGCYSPNAHSWCRGAQ